jgi:alcohol dehydrogenase class IV
LQGAGAEDSGEALAKRLIELMRKTGVPNGLNGVGFGPADVPALAASTARQVRAIANSPRETNLVDIENIYVAAMSY